MSTLYLDNKKLKVLTINGQEVYKKDSVEVVVEVYNKYINSVEAGVKVTLTNGPKSYSAITDSFGLCKFMPEYGQWTITCECPEEYEAESKTIPLQATIDMELLQERD